MNGTTQSIADAPQTNGGSVNRADPVKTYEQELSTARWWARSIAFLHTCSQFLAFCNLIWATVVLLGAFVPYLVPRDLNFVLCLLLLEGARLSSASFFAFCFQRALVYLSQDPTRINHGQDEHYLCAKRARLGSQLVQSILIGPSLIMSAIGVFCELDDLKHVDARNVQKSLRIFYCSVLFNSAVALLNLFCSTLAVPVIRRKFPMEQSILRYFDKVLANVMSCGMVQADDFEFFGFAFTMLASEFRHNVQPEAVAKNHKQLIHYMYAHRLGVDFVQIYLNSKDAHEQLAAVNMLGFWADKVWDVGVPKLRLSEELLMKLADKVGTGQVGWAATTSFGAIAASSPELARLVEGICTSRGMCLWDRLAHLVDDSSSRSLSLVRTLVVLYEQLCEGKQEAPTVFRSEFVAKLEKLAAEAESHRLRVQAAYLLHLMNRACDHKVILDIDPTKDSYWFSSEVSMLQLLRQAIAVQPFNPEHPAIREDRNCIAPPPWAKASNT